MGAQPGAEYQPNDRVPLGEWDLEFKGNGNSYRNGPVENRRCTDICCLVTFFLLLLLFIGYGAYLIHQFSVVSSELKRYQPRLSELVSVGTGRFAILCIGMPIASLLLLIGLLLMAKSHPKCMVWTIIGVSLSIMLALAIVGYVVGAIAVGVSFTVAFILYCLLLCCCLRPQLNTAIALVKCTGVFLSENAKIYLIGISIGILAILFVLYWAFSFAGLLVLSYNYPNSFTGGALTMLQILISILCYFFLLFFYYCVVFLVGASVAIWYYDVNKPMLKTSFKWLFSYHVGSLTFAALVVTIIRAIRMAVMNNSDSNPCVRCCLCLIQCVLASLEYFMRLLNHYATLSMAFTGQGYIDSAKTAGLLIFNNGALFGVIDTVTRLLVFSAVVVCVALPAFISALVMNLSTTDGLFGVGGQVITIILLTAITTMMLLTPFTETLSAIFLFYCMDKRLVESGFGGLVCPATIRPLLEVADPQSAGAVGQQPPVPNYDQPPLTQERVYL